MHMLAPFLLKDKIEAGCDEAGRGCLAGPVVAAAVILPADFSHPLLNDSKQINKKNREELRLIIEGQALDYAVAFVDHIKIDEINILKASILAMHHALDQLRGPIEHIIIDGNRFYKYQNIPHQTIVKGDGKYASIAAASILAKTYRDEYMQEAHQKFPIYGWDSNMAYATKKHRAAIDEFGPCELHRRSFRLSANRTNSSLFEKLND
ncbi:MAG: ribonuclease HII [Chitinophagales bacterium]|jgi:ribonuclease HII